MRLYVAVLAVGCFVSSTEPVLEETQVQEVPIQTDGSGDGPEDALINDQCSFYLAKSLVGTGWGVFAGRDLALNDVIDQDPSVLVVDMDWMHLVPELHVFEALTKPSQIHMGEFEADHVSVVYVYMICLTVCRWNSVNVMSHHRHSRPSFGLSLLYSFLP